MNEIKQIIKWTNDNCGFLSLLLFCATITYGWISGLFSSLIKKPKLKIRFIDKISFFSLFYTGEKYFNQELNEEFELHKSAFVSYMSIANIGNMATTIDKIFLGYYKNKKYKFWNKKELVWLAQWHSVEPFKMNLKNGQIIIAQSLRIANSVNDVNDRSHIGIGNSLVGIAYFEGITAWGNYNPLLNKNNKIDIKIKIRDIYGNNFIFKTELKYLEIEKARGFNPHFGSIEQISTVF
ncbi:hypothetical protein [Chryseobacterium sp. RU33C]|uniref:hypothetical protein n=1 Tax=Chryseobacterium sp. RU33C TaxID=1907398 RepID=UPI0009566168|nr:hypothetical protein [Chryseobacterium sp. RU33C]SIQ77192.1 hypothetical protein SAMN05880573_11030 [Chryseobacterium sp. RU33C]